MNANPMLAALLGLLVAAAPLQALAERDPPPRVARVAWVDGPVAAALAGDEDWIEAGINRPLVPGDRLWVDAEGLVELELGGAQLRLNAFTSAEVVALDAQWAEFYVGEGQASLRIEHLWPDQAYVLLTPELQLELRDPGSYRINVGRDGRVEVVAWEGRALVRSGPREQWLRAGEFLDARDFGRGDFAVLRAPRADAFDEFAFARDGERRNSPSLRHVSQDLIGYSDLDRHGRWTHVRDYGAVWFPSRIAHDWAPFRHGHWIWLEPWGWSWVDAAPWGFAVSHYGRWVRVDHRWGWVPPPRRYRAVYAPALVTFVDFGPGGFHHAQHAPLTWYPLGPREIWIPSRRFSQTYFTQVNVWHTGLSQTTIVNVYNYHFHGRGSRPVLHRRHHDYHLGWTSVSHQHFVRGRPVHQHWQPIDRTLGARGEARHLLALSPERGSLRGSAGTAPLQTWTGVQTRGGVQGLAQHPRGVGTHASGLAGHSDSTVGGGSRGLPQRGGSDSSLNFPERGDPIQAQSARGADPGSAAGLAGSRGLPSSAATPASAEAGLGTARDAMAGQRGMPQREVVEPSAPARAEPFRGGSSRDAVAGQRGMPQREALAPGAPPARAEPFRGGSSRDAAAGQRGMPQREAVAPSAPARAEPFRGGNQREAFAGQRGMPQREAVAPSAPARAEPFRGGSSRDAVAGQRGMPQREAVAPSAPARAEPFRGGSSRDAVAGQRGMPQREVVAPSAPARAEPFRGGSSRDAVAGQRGMPQREAAAPSAPARAEPFRGGDNQREAFAGQRGQPAAVHSPPPVQQVEAPARGRGGVQNQESARGADPAPRARQGVDAFRQDQ